MENTLKQEVYDLIVVGDGIMANSFLLNAPSENSLKILQVASKSQLKDCSSGSTSFVSPNGIKRSVSEFGGELLDAFDSFCSFHQKYAPKGVEEGIHFSFSKDGSESVADFERRYGELNEYQSLMGFDLSKKLFGKEYSCYVVDDLVFMDWLRSEVNHKLQDLNKCDDLIINLEKSDGLFHLKGLSGEYISKKVLLCTGYGTKLFEHSFGADPVMKGSKMRAGHFLECESFEFDQPFSISLNHLNLIYRKSTRKLIIGATNLGQNVVASPYSELEDAYNHLKEVMIGFNFPEFEKFKMREGQRHLGKKRRPFMGEIEENLYGAFSLYKNGYSLPFLYAPKLWDLIY